MACKWICMYKCVCIYRDIYIYIYILYMAQALAHNERAFIFKTCVNLGAPRAFHCPGWPSQLFREGLMRRSGARPAQARLSKIEVFCVRGSNRKSGSILRNSHMIHHQVGRHRGVGTSSDTFWHRVFRTAPYVYIYRHLYTYTCIYIYILQACPACPLVGRRSSRALIPCLPCMEAASKPEKAKKDEEDDEE